MLLRQVMEVRDVVANKDVHLVILQKKIESAKTPEEKERFEKQKFELLQVTCYYINQTRQKCSGLNIPAIVALLESIANFTD